MRWTAKHRSGLVRFVVVAVLASTLGVLAGTAPVAAENPPPFITKWGTLGTGDTQFASPYGVAVDAYGNVYTTDSVNNRVQEFTPAGAFITAWGTTGSGGGQFNTPGGIAIDGDGNVYVADENDRVQRFSSTGAFLGSWGTFGTGAGQFNDPSGVAVDGDGNVYVADKANHRIQKFTSTGTFLTMWGTSGTGEGQFRYPFGVAVDSQGSVYTSEPVNDRVQKFTSTGTFVTAWGTSGTGDGQFTVPHGLAIGADDIVYVVDNQNERIQAFTSTGAFVTKWGSQGSGDGEFSSPTAVAVDDGGNVYVTESGNHRVQRFGPPPTPDGRIRKGATGTFKGDGVYNTTGVGQTKSGSAVRGSTVTYWVSAQNDASFPDAQRLKGTASTTGFRVTYTALGEDITSAVVDGTFTTVELGPGDSLLIKVVVKVKGTAPAGSSLTGSVIVKSDEIPTWRDTVKFVTRRA